MKTYLVSYSFQNGRSSGFGNAYVTTDVPTSRAAIEDWTRQLEAEDRFSIVILNIVELDVPEE